ncbi:MAG TPA: hypothetical protein VKA34_00665, partial [Balneolales bacterium]|nr:hypothetical protein [Balneolales bacterium]
LPLFVDYKKKTSKIILVLYAVLYTMLFHDFTWSGEHTLKDGLGAQGNGVFPDKVHDLLQQFLLTLTIRGDFGVSFHSIQENSPG